MNVYNVGRVCLFVCLLHYFPKQTKKKSMLHIFTKTEQMVLLKKMYSCFNPFSLVPASSSAALYTLFILTPLLPPSN